MPRVEGRVEDLVDGIVHGGHEPGHEEAEEEGSEKVARDGPRAGHEREGAPGGDHEVLDPVVEPERLEIGEEMTERAGERSAGLERRAIPRWVAGRRGAFAPGRRAPRISAHSSIARHVVPL